MQVIQKYTKAKRLDAVDYEDVTRKGSAKEPGSMGIFL